MKCGTQHAGLEWFKREGKETGSRLGGPHA